MMWCQTPHRCAIIGHATVDDMPCVRMPIGQWAKMFASAVTVVVLAWWTVVALFAAMPASAHPVEDLNEWRDAWVAHVLIVGVTPELLDEWQYMADAHGCDWPGTECRDRRIRQDARSLGTVSADATPSSTVVPSIPRGLPTAVEQWRPLVEVYAGWDVDWMLRIMWCESHGNPWAKNPRSSATGLFQIMASIWHDGRDLYDPIVNVDVAHHVWMQQGYGAWVCRG